MKKPADWRAFAWWPVFRIRLFRRRPCYLRGAGLEISRIQVGQQNADKTIVATLRRLRGFARRLNRADIPGFFAFGTGRAYERYALVFGQALEAFRLNVLKMGEQIAAACVRRDKAEAFGIVEPFYGAGLGSHVEFL
jgi:hypothetical protein